MGVGVEVSRRISRDVKQHYQVEKAQQGTLKKTCQEMTEAEKIEDLRNNVARIFSALREIASDVGDLRTMVSEVAKKLDSLPIHIKGDGPDQH